MLLINLVASVNWELWPRSNFLPWLAWIRP